MKWSQHCRLIEANGKDYITMSIFDGRNANLSAEADLNAIQETIYLISVPGMRESIQAGLTESPVDMAKFLVWKPAEQVANRSASGCACRME